MRAPQFNTIQELINFTYGHAMGADVHKADAPVLTTTTGVFNPVFGAQAFSQLNMEGNAFAALPKYPWQKSGWRAITADAGSAADGGVSENGAIPDTIKPTFAEIEVSVGEVSHSFDISYSNELLANTGDDSIAKMEALRTYFAALHAKRINEQLLVDVDTAYSSGFESIDRVVSSNAEVSNLSLDANDADIYGLDRDGGATWADAVVDDNSGTDRTFQLSLVEDTLATLEANGARTNIILTGSDTKWRIISQAQNSVRYRGILSSETVSLGVNGVSTEEGMNFGVRVRAIYDIPLISSQAVPKDTISRIYLLDTTLQAETGVPRLGIAMLSPTLYFESGMSAANPNPFAIGRFGTEGLFYTAGQLVCTFFKAQGKIRDLK